MNRDKMRTVGFVVLVIVVALLEDEDLPEKGEYILERNGVDYIPLSISLSAADAKLRLEPGTG
jgi:chromosome partitioning protein